MLGLIGAGNMARALARGWGEGVLASDHGSGRAAQLVAEVGGESLSSVEVARRADTLVLCHKPAQTGDVAEEISEHVTGRVVSVLGGVELERLRSVYPGAEVIRAMPNTAAEVRQGVTILADSDAGRELFERLGDVFVVPERLMDPATGVIGVQPAYLALFAEAQIDAAIAAGLPETLAARLVVASMQGSAALLAHREDDTLAVRREVTSPGGMTARGLGALEQAGIRGALLDAMKAVLQR